MGFFCEKDFYYGQNYSLGLCFIFNIIKLKSNGINLTIYAVEIVFDTIFHRNFRNMTYEKEFHFLKVFVSDPFFLFYLFVYLFIYLFE